MTCFFFNKYKNTNIKKAIKWVFKLAFWLHHENTNLITTKISFQSKFTFKVEHIFIFYQLKIEAITFEIIEYLNVKFILKYSFRIIMFDI